MLEVLHIPKIKWKVFLKLLIMKWWCLVAWSGIKLNNSRDITMQKPDIIFAVRLSANILKGIQLTLSHICIYCVDSISAWWFIWRLCYIRNVLLFPTHLMCTRHLISERLSTYSWFQPGSVKFILLCKYSCIPLISLIIILISFLCFLIQVTDSGVVELARCCPLQDICLAGIQNITDKSVFALANNCPDLKTLFISGCKRITEQATNYLEVCSVNVLSFRSFSQTLLIGSHAVITCPLSWMQVHASSIS